ncbi:MAG: RecX family transcriptional regulator [Candidatus Cloacimonetes bacterium]|nr:RecX family transcriptional regulator [Candidatus Cloacimonadota bacterium]
MKNLLKIKKLNERNYLILVDELPQGVIPYSNLRHLPFAGSLLAGSEVPVDEIQIAELKSAISENAWQRLINWLALQERSSQECRSYLRKIYLEEDIAETLINKAHALNFIDDDRFAELYMQSLMEKGKSLPEIRNKLWNKAVDENQINDWLQKFYDPQQQQESLKQNLEKLLVRWQNFDQKTRKQKIYNYLTRRGFNFYDIKVSLADLEKNKENYDG